MISPELAQFLESGVSVLVGTRDARREPACMRGVGARVAANGAELTVFLPAATAATALANLADNGRIAVSFARARDHRSVQVKGRVLEVRDADGADRERIERYRRDLVEALGVVGVSPRSTLRLAHWPARAVRLRVEALFAQTPGPGAGAPLAGSAEGAGP